MNRYEISTDKYDVCVGWDTSMNTLFGLVRHKSGWGDSDDDEDHIVCLVGGAHGEIRTVEELQQLLDRFVIIPDNVVSLLQLDIIKATPKTELQEQVRKVTRGNS